MHHEAVSTPASALASVAGAAAAGLAIGVSEAIAALLPGATSLVAAVGQVVVDRQPPGAKDFVVALFGTNDKLALEVVVVLASLAFGAGLGLLAVRRFAAAAAGFATFGVLGFLAALGDPLVSPGIVAVQAAVSVGLAIQTLSWLLAQAGGLTASTADGPATSDPARRSFLMRTGAVGLAALVAGIGGRSLLDRSRSAPIAAADLPPASEVVPPLPTGADLAPATPGLTPIVVPNDSFYRIDTALLVPSVDVATWTLRIHGLVERETTLTWSELLALPMFEQYVTISCVSNEVGGNLVGNAKWTGVRLRDVLDIAGVAASATQLVGRSVDGFTAGMPTAWVMDPAREPMIAVQMNDEPLPPKHGYPARLIVPGLYGYVSATKWLAELELTTLDDFDGERGAGTDRGDRLGTRSRHLEGRGRDRRGVERGEAVDPDLRRDLGPMGRALGRRARASRDQRPRDRRHRRAPGGDPLPAGTGRGPGLAHHRGDGLLNPSLPSPRRTSESV